MQKRDHKGFLRLEQAIEVKKSELIILLIPGGTGIRNLLKNKEVISWLKKKQNIDLIFSVCTGSLLLAAAGLLKNKKASTHWSAKNFLKR